MLNTKAGRRVEYGWLARGAVWLAGAAFALPATALPGLDPKAAQLKREVEATVVATVTSTGGQASILGKVDELTASQAQAAAEDAETKKNAALDDLASGKLLEYGVTGGVALLVQSALDRDFASYHLHTGHNVVLAPYLALVPAYWFSGGPETKKYCASRWTTTEVEAQRAADNLAKERAKALVQDLMTLAAGGGEAALRASPVLARVSGSSVGGASWTAYTTARDAWRTAAGSARLVDAATKKQVATSTARLTAAQAALTERRTRHDIARKVQGDLQLVSDRSPGDKSAKASATTAGEAAEGLRAGLAQAQLDLELETSKAADAERDAIAARDRAQTNLESTRLALEQVRASLGRSDLAVALVLEATRSTDPEDATRATDALAILLSKDILDWETGVATGCGPYKFGAWLTLAPTSYDLTLSRGEGSARIFYQDVSFDRYVSFGAAWIPSAYVSVLAGFSYGEAEIRQRMPDGSETLLWPIDFWSLSLGASINADILTLFVN